MDSNSWSYWSTSAHVHCPQSECPWYHRGYHYHRGCPKNGEVKKATWLWLLSNDRGAELLGWNTKSNEKTITDFLCYYGTVEQNFWLNVTTIRWRSDFIQPFVCFYEWSPAGRGGDSCQDAHTHNILLPVVRSESTWSWEEGEKWR